jgi:hypothetical protein
MMAAFNGHTEAENEKLKSLSCLVRTATTMLWNTQVVEESRKSETELWRFPWEADETGITERINSEERKKIIELHTEILNGNSNIKS